MTQKNLHTNWHRNAIFYELYIRAFHDGNNDGHGDFDGLRQRLDYLQWLGVEVVWLLPMYPSPLKDDGYDVASYYGIHPTYGQLEDFMMTLDEIHRRGMKVVTDLVLNHTSDQHPWFQEARRSKDSPMHDYYVWTEDPEKYKEARIIFLDTERSNWAYNAATGEYYWHRFYSTQPDLNYDNPRVREEAFKMVKFWLDLGVDGFRLDAIPYLFEREGTNCENLPETHTFLKEIRKFVDDNYPGRILLAEANQWPQDLLPYFGNSDELHMCFNFPVMPRLYMAVAKGDKSPVVEIVNATPAIPEGCEWATFLRNHDELTLEMVTPEDRTFMWDYYAPEYSQRLNLGIRRRLAPLMNNDRDKIELMHSLLLTLPGTPVLYYGDEIGMGDDISLPDRNGVRTPMQWSEAINGGFSGTLNDSLYAPVIRDPIYGFQKINVISQQTDASSLLHTVRNMLTTRKAQTALLDGTFGWYETGTNAVLGVTRTTSSESVIALHNLTDAEQTINLPEGKIYVNLLSGGECTGTITMKRYGYLWLREQ